MSSFLISERKKNQIENVISSNVINLTNGRRRNVSITPAISGGGDYSGPFAVYSGTESLMMTGGFIDIGLEPMEIEDYELTLTTTGWVYLKITYDENYTVEVLNNAEFPVQTNTELYIRIAHVEFEDDAVKTITQYQYGGINLFGRVF